ncbi:MAG: OsmC family peroxiredoxin, partial [Gammaproteobacteria bacterium]|nr:OsmC family peroxiredoxin [Gammaproteobacteria bacterium]
LVYHASLIGVRIQEIESQVEGNLDLQGFLGLRDDVHNGFEDVRATFRVRADCSAETLGELMLVARRRSPVLEILAGKVPMAVSCEPM